MPNYIALSIVAPNGKHIANGLKTLEIRSWLPSLTLPLKNLLIVENDIYLNASIPSDPNGRAVAWVDVIAVEPWQMTQVVPACSKQWMPGYYAWHLANVRKLKTPIAVFAQRGLYEVTLADDMILQMMD